MSTERIAEIRERCEKATPGPWQQEKKPTAIGHAHCFDPIGGCIYVDTRGGVCDRDEAQAEADAEFMMHARSDLPWLLTRLEDAREVMEFYGDPETWGKSVGSVRVASPLGRDRDTAPSGHDSPGAKARRWLKGEG